MWKKNLYRTVLAGALAMGCLLTAAGAAQVQARGVSMGEIQQEMVDFSQLRTLDESAVPRAAGYLDFSVPANTIMSASDAFFLDAGETVTINCSYSPASASMDFGLVDSDGIFYSLNVTGGSINKSIQVSERGSYTLAIRNNSSSSVRVVGFVNY